MGDSEKSKARETAVSAVRRGGRRSRFGRMKLPPKKDIPFLLLLLPAVLTVVIFSYLPFSGLVMAFREAGYRDVLRDGFFAGEWADHFGFGVFIRAFDMPGFVNAIKNTLMLSCLSLIFSFPLPIIFALLLDEVKGKRFKSLVQTISYLPHFLSWTVIVGIFLNMSSQGGLIYNLLGDNPTKNPDAFVPVYLLLTIWQSMGWGSILYTSALSGISQDLYEAAAIDGAGRFRQVIAISLPEVIPTAMIMLILRVGQIFGSNFELVYMLNTGTWSTDVLSTLIYRKGWVEPDYSFSTAVSIMQGGVALILTLAANWISKKISNVSML